MAADADSRFADVRQRLEKGLATLQASSDDVARVLHSIDQAMPDGGPEIGLDTLVHEVAASGQNEAYRGLAQQLVSKWKEQKEKVAVKKVKHEHKADKVLGEKSGKPPEKRAKIDGSGVAKSDELSAVVKEAVRRELDKTQRELRDMQARVIALEELLVEKFAAAASAN